MKIEKENGVIVYNELLNIITKAEKLVEILAGTKKYNEEMLQEMTVKYLKYSGITQQVNELVCNIVSSGLEKCNAGKIK